MLFTLAMWHDMTLASSLARSLTIYDDSAEIVGILAGIYERGCSLFVRLFDLDSGKTWKPRLRTSHSLTHFCFGIIFASMERLGAGAVRETGYGRTLR